MGKDERMVRLMRIDGGRQEHLAMLVYSDVSLKGALIRREWNILCIEVFFLQKLIITSALLSS